jgi:TolB-like protein/Flp pilus assembly protein TadD
VIITPEGRAKVLDFGLAKRLSGKELSEATTLSHATLTEAGAVAGTPAYMAPEQLRGLAADERSDIWALGVVLYEMATGRRPFQGKTSFELSSAIFSQEPPPLPPAVPAPLATVIERCLAKEQGARYQRGNEVRAALETIQSGGAPSPWPAWRYALERRRWLLFAAAVVATVALLAGLDAFGLKSRLFGGAAFSGIDSLAVLPLENLSGDPEQGYLAEGMHDALITDLARLSGLKRVVARGSVLRFKGTNTSLRTIAQELKFAALITGAVLKSGDRVRITAQLINPVTEAQVWAHSYERPLRDVLALQNEIVAAITREVKLQLTPQEKTRLASARPVNLETYEAYLKGMFYLYKKTPEGFAKGLALLQQAIEKDPSDPLPYAGLALAYPIIYHGPGGTIPPKEGFPRARAAALKALELDESSAQAHLAFAAVTAYFDWDWAGGEKEFKRALELNPHLVEGHAHYGWYHHLFGRNEEALAEVKKAQELDPLTPIYTAWVGWLYLNLGQPDKAIEEARKALDMDPNLVDGLLVLGSAYAQKKMFEDAVTAHQKLAAVNPDWKSSLAETYALAGRRNDALKLVADMEREDYSKFGLDIFGIQTILGKKDEAFRALDAAFEYRHIFLPWVMKDDTFPWRSDARWQEYLRRMNFPKG